MNIMIVTPYFYPRRGGAENYAYNIAKILSERGHDITIFTSGEVNSEENIAGLDIIRLKPNFRISNTPVRYNIISKISRIIRERNIDIVNAHTPVPFYADMAALASKMSHRPFVLTYHNDPLKFSSYLKLLSVIYSKTLLRLTLKLSSRIITPSPYVYNESSFTEDYHEKMTWIPPAVDIETYSPRDEDSILKKILFVGAMNRGHDHKGVDVLLRAFKQVSETYKDVRLVLVGTGDMVTHYQGMARELEISEIVTFKGSVDEKTLIDIYRDSYALVLPTKTIAEGFGMVLIEANACGKPVIGSRIGGIKYVIKDGETGLLVPPGDPGALADAIMKLLDDEELARKLGLNGRKLVEKNYTWERGAGMTENVFEEVVS
ncbi:glycosyltransferase involved in cell wall biosynthesis [Methanothermobacter defluvii]|jgi:glycosyltransferase involved in cell wall biosynthesis|uniref:Glycosyltransferase involved in cell wall biosynthesis n=1 Tax=Methanothermobacter defluvii TaxID=49339 RepID=A0A371NG89_9EURY|nr:glycosyltransferase family 4 protein [Methanothermobacter defluvii]REE28988.1 glycosyltransferase involved in cell wall biosynthesis [Methanothermobacter defluvii]